MEKFTIKNCRTNEILHEGEAESFKEFVEKNKGNLKSAYLKYANLECANLEDANLKDANLECANLECANLEGADLFFANLNDANLKDANLEGANLECANLEGTNLEGANLEGTNLQDSIISIYSKRNITIQLPNSSIEKQDINEIKIVIGCKIKTIKEWDTWFASNEEYETKRGTFEFRQIEATYEAYKAYVVKLWS